MFNAVIRSGIILNVLVKNVAS